MSEITAQGTTTAAQHARRASSTMDRQVRRNPWIVALGRTGWVAKGVVYGIIGFIAVRIATDGQAGGAAQDGQEEASQSGAVAEIAESGAGVALLWVVGIGLLLYAAWRLLTAVLPGDDGAEAWVKRLGYLASATIYTVLGWTALAFALSGGQAGAGSAESEDSRIERMTGSVMENAAGRWLVGAVGVALFALAAYFLVKALRRDFEDELEPGGVGPISERWLVRLGRIGWAARAVTVALIATFLVRAAVTYSADEAEGLDGALRRTADGTVGAWLVVLTGAGLVVYGAYCVISSPRRRLSGPS